MPWLAPPNTLAGPQDAVPSLAWVRHGQTLVYDQVYIPKHPPYNVKLNTYTSPGQAPRTMVSYGFADEEPKPMADERSPLIQTVPVGDPPQRYPHQRVRRVCTYAVVTITAFVLGALVAAAFIQPSWQRDRDTANALSSDGLSVSAAWPLSDGISYEELQTILTETPDADKAREWSKYYTAGPHLAGKNLSQAIWTKERWQEFGISQTEIVAYDVYINYPKDHRLALLEKSEDEDAVGAWKVSYEAGLEEDVLPEDETSGLPERVPTFHGYSASGNVTAPYVYVNYGTFKDFEDLQKANVSLEGKIALVKYGGIFRGLKIKRAAELGMIGAVLYSDPGDDGEVTEENGFKPYPEGPARNPSSVQRGSAQFLSIAPGDPTTIGYPSLPGAPRQSVDGKIPDIPSIPISYQDALPLLQALNGHGPKASSFNKYWQGGGLGYKGVKYNIGPTPDDVVLNLVNEQEYVTTPLWNVIGIINGSIPDEVVVLGNHRDAWIAGGAGDPNSGSAAMNELIRSYGAALAQGWKPLRTIVFASWDGEEYGLIGSTEWVEQYLPWLSHATVAYLNVDVGSTGPHFTAAAAPLLDKALIEATHLVQSPNQTVANQTVGDVWDQRIRTMGSGSDFTAFQDFAGIPCVDLGFKNDDRSAVYHYHSNYDSFHWMAHYGDAGFAYHVAITQIWALLAASLIESPIIQFNATNYAAGLARYLKTVEAKTQALELRDDTNIAEWNTPALFAPLHAAIARLHNAAQAHDSRAAALAADIAAHPLPWWKWWQKLQLYYKVRAVNVKYKFLERQFLHAEGLDGRSWFKHVVFAPGVWTGYAGATFPGLVEAIEAGERGGAMKWAGIIAGLLNKAAGWLEE